MPPRKQLLGFWRLLLAAAACTCVARADHVGSDGKVHVAYWDKWVSFEGQAMQAVVDQFNASQDRIVVDYTAMSQPDRKIMVAIAGGDPPDLAGLWAYNLATFADAEAIEPLDDRMRADAGSPQKWVDRYYPVFAKICQHGGHVYAAISTPATIALYWNRTLFREAGLDPDRPPRTLQELDEYNRRLTKRDPKTGAITQVGFLPQEPGWWQWAFFLWAGGSLFDGRHVTIGTDPRNLELLKWVRRFSTDYGVENMNVFTSGFGQQASPQAAFFTGKVAMVLQGVWYNNFVRQYKPGLDYGVGAWPVAAPGLDNFAVAEADLLAIPRGARNPDAAWEFIRYVSSHNPRAQTKDELRGIELLCYLQEKASPLREWSPYFTAHHPNPHIDVFRQLSASPHAVSVPNMGIWQQYQREIVSLFDRVRLLEATPDEALQDSQQRISESWNHYLKSLRLHGQVAPE